MGYVAANGVYVETPTPRGKLMRTDTLPTDSDGATAVAYVMNIVGEPTGTEAGLLAAMSLCSSMGGGDVRLKAGVTYDITATLPYYSRVRIVGSGWVSTSGSIPDAGDTHFLSGSRIRAMGAFPIFQYNSGVWDWETKTDTQDLSLAAAQTLYGTGTAGQAAYAATAIFQSVFKDVCLDGNNVGTYGIKAGAQNRASFHFCEPVENCLITNFTQAGLWIENYQHINVVAANVFGCQKAQAWFCISTDHTFLAPGNSTLDRWLSTIPTSNNLTSRGLVVAARQGALAGTNRLISPQSNRFNQQTYSETPTFTSGNANIAVVDLSKFPPDMPVVFSGNNYGLPATGSVLFVLSRSATSGAGNITIGYACGIASSLFTPSGSGTAVQIKTQGFPCIELVGFDTAQLVGASVSCSGDFEAGGTAQILVQNCLAWKLDAQNIAQADGTSSTQNLAVINSPYGEAYLESQAKTYAYNSNNWRRFGRCGPHTGSGSPIGLWLDQNNNYTLNMAPGAAAGTLPTLAMDTGNLWLPQSRGYIGSSLKQRFTAAKTLSWNFDIGHIVMDGAGTPPITLPVVDANSAGQFFTIEFAQPATIATQSGQTINGLGITATAALPAGTKVVCWAENNNGTFAWSLLSTDQSLCSGAGLRNAANDGAAAALSPAVPIGGLYRNGSVVMVRVA